MLTTKRRNTTMVIFLILCIVLGIGFYFYRAQSNLTHYQADIPTNDAVQNIKLASGGNDINISFANTGTSTIKLAAYVTPAFIKQDEIIQKQADALNLNFNNSQGHRLFNAKKAGHTVNLAIPITAATKLKTVILNSNGGNVHLSNISQPHTVIVNSNGGDVYLTSQDALALNLNIVTDGGKNAFADNGRGNVNNGGKLIINTHGGDVVRSK